MSIPHEKTGNYWAMWWGITLALLVLAAATISFNLDDRDVLASASRDYSVGTPSH